MKKIKLISFILAMLITVTSLPIAPVYTQDELPTEVTSPFDSQVRFPLNGSTATSSIYRIPAMVTLNDGTIVAAADIRWDTTYDGGGLDTLVARSTDGGVTWSYNVANYLGDNGNSYSGSSTAFIDPALTVAPDGTTVYMLVDLYPYGIALNGSGNTAPSTEVGFDSSGRLKLKKGNSYSYGYYLEGEYIYSTSGARESGYSVDEYFNLYYNGVKQSNLFFSDSDYRVARTGYLYLTKSTDGGATWSAPTLLNLKSANEQVCLVGPGRGLTTSNGTMIFPIYSFNGSTDSQRVGFIYSTDGVNWSRVNSSIQWSSESAVVEVGTGLLRFFYRNGSSRLCYVDYNMNTNSWDNPKELSNIVTNSNTQISAITHSKTSDGKQVILVSCPTGPNGNGSTSSSVNERKNGRIFVFTVDSATNDLVWEETVNVNDNNAYFMYSCLTERSDGSVVILYEGTSNYAMSLKVFSEADLKLTFDGDEGNEGGNTPEPDQSYDYEYTISVGESFDLTVSDSENVGTAGEFTSENGAVAYNVVHGAEASSATYEQVGALVCNDIITYDTNEWVDTGYYFMTLGEYFPLYVKRTSYYSYLYYFTWGYSTSGSSSSVTQIEETRAFSSDLATKKTNIEQIYTKVGGESTPSTNVTFTGLAASKGTYITIGDVTYKIIVSTPKIEESIFVINGSQKTLNAVADLGLTDSGYNVTYVKTQDESSIIDSITNGTVVAHATNSGSATIVATVRTANGEIVGTVIYTLTVSAVEITETKNLYMAVDYTATLSGLTGDMISGMLDTSIATVAYNDGTLTATGVSEGRTAVVIGSVLVNLFVNPKNTQYGSINVPLNISIDTIENCSVYYAINGGELHKIDSLGPLVDQYYTSGFNIMFFAVPNEGYALTIMGATQSASQYYTVSNGVLADGSDSDAWPLTRSDVTVLPSSTDSVWKTGHGYVNVLLQGNMTLERMRDLFTRAIALGADGSNTFTRNNNSAINTELVFRAEKLPTLEKTIVKVERDGEELEYNDSTMLRFGDVITYEFTITSYSTNVTYSSVVLSDSLIGYSNTITDPVATAGTYGGYTATYTIKQEDLDKYENGSFTNNASLNYSYSTRYSNGNYKSSASASVSCRISGIVYYAWADNVPAAIKDNTDAYPRPSYSVIGYDHDFTVSPYTGATVYEVNENGYLTGTWTFSHWEYNESEYHGGETLTMPYESVVFYGVWDFVEAPKYTVTYQWYNAPADAVIPNDSNSYYAGQPVTLDSTFFSGYQHDDGTIISTFGGWKLGAETVTGEIIMGSANIVISGIWSSTHKMTYLTITKTDGSDDTTIDSSQTFVFRITGGSDNVDLTVTVHGEGSVTIIAGLLVGEEYTVTEITDWAWRYKLNGWSFSSSEVDYETGTGEARITLADDNNVLTFTNTLDKVYWLDGDAHNVNIFNSSN